MSVGVLKVPASAAVQIESDQADGAAAPCDGDNENKPHGVAAGAAFSSC